MAFKPACNSATKVNVDTYIILGQSNASGLGDKNDLSVPLQQPQAGSKIFNYITNLYEDIQAGVNTLGNIAGYFGPEFNLLTSLRAYRGADQYCIKYGIGGTALAVDAAQDWNVANVGELYDLSKARIREGKNTILSANKIPVFKAIIWMQGESDALTLGYANAYQTNLEAFIAGMRTFLALPNLPFVIGRINYPAATYRATVRTAQDTVGGQSNNYVINTDSYALRGDNLHYNTAGQLQFGLDIFNIVKNF